MTDSTKYLIALDAGTTSCRAMLLNSEFKLLDICQHEFRQYFPQSGWVEHDAEEIWNVQLKVFEDLLTHNKLQAEDILGIGITNQRETTVVWSRESGRPVHNAIVWQDRRTADLCDELKKKGYTDMIRNATGLVIDAYFSASKIQWILNSDASLRAMAEAGELCFGTIDSWLIYKLTNGRQHKTDFTNASRTMLYNIRTHSWDDELLNLFEVPESILPQVCGSASLFGHFEFDGCSIPICGVAGDQQAALFGQACFDQGMAKNTYGTGCFLLMNTGKEIKLSQNGLITTLCCDAHGEPAYALEGSVFVAGAAIQWLRDGLKIIEKSSDTEQIAEGVKDKHDVYVVPAFTGLGAPYWNAYARGAIFGLSRATESDEIIKATLDALAYQSRDILQAMEEDAGVNLKVLNVDGGAVANNYLMQFQSDILQTVVQRPENTETTALGAAYLAGLYLGILNSERIGELRTLDRVFEPQMAKQDSEKLYAKWKNAVGRTLNWIEKEDEGI